MRDMGSCPRGKPPRRAVSETRAGSAGLRDKDHSRQDTPSARRRQEIVE
jgi:hypothetical protein